MASNPSPAPSPPATAAPSTPGGWLARNLTTLLLVALGAFILYRLLRNSLDPVEDLIDYAKVVVALGLVIFIHELGHFVAAKLCDVHVEAFSIGFGPPLLGFCSFKWGETTYKIGWIPLGGYVKMVGEGEDNEENADDPRSYKNKKVWQRMIIISAGVVMNMILALVCYVFVYMTHGEDRDPGIVGTVAPGGPAWKKGLRPGAVIRQIGDRRDPYYDELRRVVMRAGKENPVPIVFDTFDPSGRQQHFETEITPARGNGVLAPMLLLSASNVPTLTHKLRGRNVPVIVGSPAERAEPGLQFNDRVVGATDPDQPERVTPLRPDPRYPGTDRLDFYDLERRLKRLAGKPIVLRVLREGSSSPIDVTVPPAFSRTLGVRMAMGPVVAVRENSPAAAAGLVPKEGLGDGDILNEVKVKGRNGKLLHFTAVHPSPPGQVPLDPMRLPAQLAEWAESKPDDLTVELTVLRQKQHKNEKVVLRLTWDPTWDLYDSPPWTPGSPVSIAPLGLAYLVQTSVAGIDPDSPASGTDLKEGNEVRAIELKWLTRRGEVESESQDLKGTDWAYYFSSYVQPAFQGDNRVTEVVLKLADDRKVTLTPVEDPTWPLVERGLVFEREKRAMKADGLIDAVVISAERCSTRMQEIYENLHGIGTGRVSVLALGGPGTIADRAFKLAGEDTYQFLLFIALININLAVVNFLPIPVLDGGHMMFLLYEGLRGKPPSDRWRFWLTMFGLVIVLGLMALTLGLDFDRFIVPVLKRWFGW